MSSLKEFARKNLPMPVYGALRDGRDSLVRAGQWPEATFHPWRRETVQRLNAMRDQHRGKRCFILGNGPSLKQTDLSKLKNEYTFGMNRIYLGFAEMGFATSYYVCMNDLVSQQCAADILALPMPRFVSWRARKWMTPQENLFFLHATYTGPKFTGDITSRLWEGATVTNITLQIAFFLGFEQAILIGVDHNYATKGKPNETVVSQGDDPNHFHPGYFGKGFVWQLPDLETSEIGYRMARQMYESAGRQVIDATVGGKLRIFPRVEYESLFNAGAPVAKE
jgi:hypothetical protein